MNLDDPFAPTDPLGEALHILRMNGAFYARSELTAPWGPTMPAMPGNLWFHVATTGSYQLEVEDGEVRTLAAGDLALVPYGEVTSCSEPGAPAPGILDIDRGDQRALRGPPLRRRRRIGHADLRRGALRSPGGTPAGAEPAAADHPRRGGRRVDGGHPAPDGGRGERAPPRRRGGHHPARRHPRHPGDPQLDRDRPGRPHRLARRAAGTARSAARSRSCTASPRATGLWDRWRARVAAMSRSAFAAADRAGRRARDGLRRAGACTSPSAPCARRAPPSASSPTASAIAWRPRSAARSSASSASRPALRVRPARHTRRVERALDPVQRDGLRLGQLASSTPVAGVPCAAARRRGRCRSRPPRSCP